MLHFLLVPITLCLLLVANGGLHAQRRAAQEYQVSEMLDYFGGMARLGQNYSRAYAVYQQFQAHSGKSFPVYLAQTFQWGQAHYGGTIVLDVSSTNKAAPILAFILAHEWGHEDLGHQPNLYNPYGNQWRIRASPTQEEDEADEYAGAFLARYGYDIRVVTQFLSTLPYSPHGDSHSDGPARARTVASA
jgi:hypothetical protein